MKKRFEIQDGVSIASAICMLFGSDAKCIEALSEYRYIWAWQNYL